MDITNAHVERFSAGNYEALRRGHQVDVETRYGSAETIFTTLGEYAIQQPPGEQWRLTPAEGWHELRGNPDAYPVYRPDWISAEEMRTRTGEGTFAPDHMDAVEQTLVAPHRVCTDSNKLAISSLGDLEKILAEYKVSTTAWRPADVQNLCNYLRAPDGQAVENVALHARGDELWLATAQSMVNVYYRDAENQTWRLRELHKRYYDQAGALGGPVPSRQKSSLGETGHLIDGAPERPFDTARRGLREEIKVSERAIAQLVATGSLLRLKRQGHHRFGPTIKAQDTTHYFDAWLNPNAVSHDGYTNIEVDGKGRPRVAIKLGWSLIESA